LITVTQTNSMCGSGRPVAYIDFAYYPNTLTQAVAKA